jgi:hypothetical protein
MAPPGAEPKAQTKRWGKASGSAAAGSDTPPPPPWPEDVFEEPPPPPPPLEADPAELMPLPPLPMPEVTDPSTTPPEVITAVGTPLLTDPHAAADIEHRLTSLEMSVAVIEQKLDRILEFLERGPQRLEC